jgi:3-hydroxymyristoyl/3-hydroxydecanoyl-(acyl carrier protein) dehydratase
MWQSLALHFAADHPTAAGHFPSNPIIPGAVLLNEVVAAVAGALGHDAVMVRAAKFLHPVCPGTSLNLRWQCLSPSTVKFECELAGSGTALSGMLEISPVPA